MFGLEPNYAAQRADDNPLSFGTVVKGSKCEQAASSGCKALNRRLDCSAAEIRLRWRANVNQLSMQSARLLHAGGRRESTGFVTAAPSDSRW
jgi:hypothetical protein